MADDLRGFFTNEGSEEEEYIRPPTPLPFTPTPPEAPLLPLPPAALPTPPPAATPASTTSAAPNY